MIQPTRHVPDRSSCRHLLWAACLLLALAPAAEATTYMQIEDARLADGASAIALVTVTGVETGPGRAVPSTDYIVSVRRVVGGELPASDIVVRVPGGVRPDGIGLRIWGAPRFEIGEEALLFLLSDSDGSYQILHLLLGAFHVREEHGVRKLALRDLSEAHRLDRGPEEPTRDLNAFVEWLSDRARGLQRAPDYGVAAPSGPLLMLERFTSMEGPEGVAPRWFAFDSGKDIRWHSQSTGQPGLTQAQTVDSLKRALAAWTDDPTSTIKYGYAGPAEVKSALRTTDGVNAVVFNDPTGVVPGSFDCDDGGILAIGGPFFYTSSRSYRGRQFHEIIEADVITNDGAECFYRNNPVGTEEVFGHELGHTLGFSHSAERQALMWAGAHDDGRGARLHADDRVGASAMYGDGSFQPPAPSAPAPQLSAGLSARRSVRLSWKHSLSGVQNFRIEVKQNDGEFREALRIAGKSRRAVLRGLTTGSVYVFRVQAILKTGSLSGFSNEARVQVKK